jgi:glycosyltransferase involved in cell wall biosynthesis
MKNHNAPFFSVVISTKNRATLVVKAVQSILNQSFNNFEILLVDNASTDNTEEALSYIQDFRLHYIKNEVDKERCFARNRGIKNAKGTYICFLDSDDEYLPNHLQVIYDKIQESNLKKALFFTSAYETYNFENLQERICPNLEDFELFEYILTYTFNPARVAVHHSVLEEFQFDEQIPGLEDLDLWLRIATKYPITQIPKRTIVYQIHDESYSVAAPNRFKRELSLFNHVFTKQILKDFLPIQSKRRLLSMCHYKISMAMSTSFNPFIVHYHILKAFSLYPKGYNSNANKTMLVIFLDQIPILGFGFKYLRRILKKIS